MSVYFTRRLFDPRDLSQARPCGIAIKKEAYIQAIKDLKWNLILLFFTLSFMFLPLSIMSGVWYFSLSLPFSFLLLGGLNVSSRADYLMNPLLYSDLARQRDEIGEFLKERGYIDSK